MAENSLTPDAALYGLFIRQIVTPTLADGDFFDVEEPHNYFFLEIGQGVELLFNARPPATVIPRGMGYQYPIDQSVPRVRVVNRSGSPQAITFFYGRGNIIDSRLTFSGAAVNVIVGGAPSFDSLADVAIPATSTASVLAANANRATAIITNIQAGVTLRIGDSGAGAANGIALAPNQSVSIDTQGAIFAYNPSGAPATVTVAQTLTV